MPRHLIPALLLITLFSTSAHPSDWHPARGPLMTRWAKDVSPDNVHAEYPRPQLVRERWINLNGLWQLEFAQADQPPPIGRELSERILVPFPVESALSGVMKRAERLWYRRTLEVPDSWSGDDLLLHFGAVDWEATVYFNGHRLGVHRGGYDAFGFEVSHLVRDDGPQEIVVGVFDPTNAGTQPRGKQVNNPKGIYYTPTTGIWQTVWLEPVPKSRIDSIHIVPDVDGSRVRVTVDTEGAAKGHIVEAVVMAGSDEVARVVRPVGGSIEIDLPGAHLWSPDDPYLYDIRLSLSDGRRTLDKVDSYFGMRKIEVAQDDQGVNRILLNGEFVFQVGPLDQGFWPDGLYTAPTDEALRYDLEMTKKLGFNMTRKHVKIEPARWYYWCDKLGLLVWQDMPSGDHAVRKGEGQMTRTPEAAEQFELELRRMIEGLRNHPSIIMWVVFNEGWGQYDTVRLTNWTKQFDPTRLVNCASGWNDYPVGDVLDIHAYPGPQAPETQPDRAGVLGEFGGLGLGVDGHTWTDETWGYRGTASRQELTRRYEGLLRRAWQFKDTAGMSAAIYTQITDVETEANGLLTYDRAVLKVDLDRTAAANRGRFPELRTLVATSETEPKQWRYSFDQPSDDWHQPDFDASRWREGHGGFGTEGTPGAVVRTEWNTPDIWLRREFTLPDRAWGEMLFAIHHDEDVEVYLNGVPAGTGESYSTEYTEMPVSEQGRAALKPGRNVMAVHCRQTGGGQYIDVGIVELVKQDD